MYKQQYKLFWVTPFGSDWSEFTLLHAPEKKPTHKKNIHAVKNHVLLKPHIHYIQIIKPI